MSRRANFDVVSQQIVRDLFDGSPHAPRRKPANKRPRRKPARRARNVAPPKRPAPKRHYADIPCPCCGKPVGAPSLEIAIDHYGLTPLEARVLGAIWRGKGMPIMAERVFDAMYIDDPDGGPSPSKMYLAFKVSLCHLRKKLKGSGISIENVGYRRGYRLNVGK